MSKFQISLNKCYRIWQKLQLDIKYYSEIYFKNKSSYCNMLKKPLLPNWYHLKLYLHRKILKNIFFWKADLKCTLVQFLQKNPACIVFWPSLPKILRTSLHDTTGQFRASSVVEDSIQRKIYFQFFFCQQVRIFAGCLLKWAFSI